MGGRPRVSRPSFFVLAKFRKAGDGCFDLIFFFFAQTQVFLRLSQDLCGGGGCEFGVFQTTAQATEFFTQFLHRFFKSCYFRVDVDQPFKRQAKGPTLHWDCHATLWKCVNF